MTAMHVLVTRPAEDAEALAALLGERGVAATAEPLFEIVYKTGPELDLSGVQAVLATSANGVRALATATENRDIGMLAVGDATARAARDAGFANVESAGGDVRDLAELASRLLRPDGGDLLHVAGSHIAGDLASLLGDKGFSYRREVLYEAKAVSRLSGAAAALIRDETLDGVLFFSPRTAETFVTLVRRARLVRACRRMTAYCLSVAVAERARAIEWKDIAVAKAPDQGSLLALMEIPSFGPWSEMSESSKKRSKSRKAPKAEAPDESVEGPATQEGSPETAESDAAPDTAESTPLPEPEDASPDGPPTRPLRRRSIVPAVILWTFLSLAIVGGAVFAARPFWQPYVDTYIQAMQKDPFQDPRFSGLADRLQILEGLATENQKSSDALNELEQRRAELSQKVGQLVGRVEGLESALDSVKKMVDATNLPLQAEDARKSLEDLSQRLALLEESGVVTDLKAGLEQLGAENERMSASVADINQRIQGFEANRANWDDGLRETLVAIESLRTALRSAAPFGTELKALEEAAQDQPELVEAASGLSGYVDQGIPTLATLRDRFADVARNAVAASRRVEGEGWFAGVVNRLTSLVTVRRTRTDDDGNSVDAWVAKAETAVAEGDLVGAVQSLEGLRGAPAAEAAAWLDDARARIAAERAISVLHVFALSMMNTKAE